jgi:hypothetical protein
MLYLFILILLIAIVMYVRSLNRFMSKHQWSSYFENLTFDSEDFYMQIITWLKEKKIPMISFARESFLESHIGSAKREYLRITRNEYVYYIGAMQLGTGMIVSEWQCEKKVGWVSVIPFVSKMAGKDRTDKSFYQTDVDSGYGAAVHQSLTEVLDGITTKNGVRGLSESEKKFVRTK